MWHIGLIDFLYQITWHKAWKAHLGRESDKICEHTEERRVNFDSGWRERLHGRGNIPVGLDKWDDFDSMKDRKGQPRSGCI